MLETNQLKDLARRIVDKRLPSVQLDNVLTENITNSEGAPALLITLVLTPETVNAITGDEALRLLVNIHDELIREGEERFPIVEYATVDDLNEQGE